MTVNIIETWTTMDKGCKINSYSLNFKRGMAFMLRWLMMVKVLDHSPAKSVEFFEQISERRPGVEI